MRRTRTFALMTALLTLTLGACSDGATGPEEPSVPSVAGTWTGSFGGQAIRLSLTQSGANVTGELVSGNRIPLSYEVTGTVDATGQFRWSTDTNDADCSFYSSGGLQLEDGASALSGPMLRSSQNPPCDQASRRAITSGSTSLTRAF